jgi:hypothetical protein
MGWAWSCDMEDKNIVQNLTVNLLENGHLQNWGVSRIASILEMGCEDDRWMKPDQDRMEWRVVVLAVLNLRGLLSVIWIAN